MTIKTEKVAKPFATRSFSMLPVGAICKDSRTGLSWRRIVDGAAFVCRGCGGTHVAGMDELLDIERDLAAGRDTAYGPWTVLELPEDPARAEQIRAQEEEEAALLLVADVAMLFLLVRIGAIAVSVSDNNDLSDTGHHVIDVAAEVDAPMLVDAPVSVEAARIEEEAT